MQNIVWYQINPAYFGQLAYLKQLAAGARANASIFEIIQHNLMRIKSMGCQGIWLMPCYLRGQVNRKGFGSPYAIYDYSIDPAYGTEEELQQMVSAAKDMALNVIGEYVPNHLSPDAPFLSNNPELTYRTASGEPFHEHDWHDVVKLNHAHPTVKGFTSANLINLSKRFGLQGFRLDMAHYPLHGAHGAAHGAGAPLFWQEIFADPPLQPGNMFWLAEVYDDRNQEYGGYGDHLKLIQAGMRAYDKKTHDILARKLQGQAQDWCVQASLFDELYAQAQVCHIAGIDIRRGYVPFLRIPSNHDDCPGARIFGSPAKLIVAYALLMFLPGDCMVYAGEEFGYAVKPSVTGINYTDASGTLTGSNQIHLLEENHQQLLNAALSTILKLRQQQATLSRGALLMPKLTTNAGHMSHDIVAFMRYLPEEREMILVAANLDASSETAWAKVDEFLPTFDFPRHEFHLVELMNWINPSWNANGYKLHNLVTGEMLPREPNTELWLGLKPLEVQVLKFTSIA